MNKHPLLVIVGLKIREARKLNGMTQENFAREVGLARSFYGRLERGEHNVSSLTLSKIALSLGVEVSTFFPPLEEIKEIIERSE